MSFTLTVGYTTSNKIVLVDYSPWCVLLCLSSTTTWTFIYRQSHVCNVVSEWDYDSEFSSSPTEVDALNIAVLYPNPTTTILNFLDKLWFCFGRYTQNSAAGTLILHHQLCDMVLLHHVKNISVACLSLSAWADPFVVLHLTEKLFTPQLFTVSKGCH